MRLAPLADPGYRQPLFARRGAVATSQPLAAEAGLGILRAGGNAVDAAVAMAACLPVVEPCSNGLGSDAFALVWDGDHLHGLNGSGRAPASASASRLRDRGLTTMPVWGWEAVTVPGAVRAWADLHRRFGRLSFSDVMEPAIALATEGFALSGVVAWGWHRGVAAAAARASEPSAAGFAPLFAPGGRAPEVGEVWRSPEMAATLTAIAASSGEDFYTGGLGARMVAFARATDGSLTAGDLAGHTSEWVQPISARYRDHEVWEVPPNGQGIAALIALNVLDGFTPDEAADWHRQIESVKMALADTHALLGDPAVVDVPVEALLSAGHAARRRASIGARALAPVAVDPRASDTVYLCAADGDGMMVSFIQSNFHGFGAQVVVPGTGISLQNRGAGFSLEPGHPNELAPGKRPFHTVIPGFLTRGGAPVGPFGVMGGHMQAQGHVQVVLHTVDGGDDPQTALGRPRWFWDPATGRVQVEASAGTKPSRNCGRTATTRWWGNTRRSSAAARRSGDFTPTTLAASSSPDPNLARTVIRSAGDATAGRLTDPGLPPYSFVCRRFEEVHADVDQLCRSRSAARARPLIATAPGFRPQ
ncbi:gamma-glutamyltransferase family protein [Tessaracoccus antarcticus]|uniref:gamma-glutamyltransferase family protein n=1 Tax=Tessaracoccus antarcticus TaxID=2479848 RepID=UPI0018F79AD4|nr:gamma-glutamyltransferase family protein [Tessaracoccus antarcticus]